MIGRRAWIALAGLLLGCNQATEHIDVERAERAVDEAHRQVEVAEAKVEEGLKTARDRVEEVGEDLGKAAGQVQSRVEDVTADAIQASTDEELAAILRDAPAAISCEGESCTIQQSVADRLRAKPATFASQAKVDPERRDGRVVGLRLSEVEALPQLLGFRDRDVIVSVNGMRVQSLQTVPQLFLQLRSASRFTIEYERAGVRATKVIAIV